MLYVVPIEPLEERYSAQWLTWTQRELSRLMPSKSVFITPEIKNYTRIKQGAFLDVCNTHVCKFSQLKTISNLLATNSVKDGDVFWFHDLWFPGLEALAYMRQGTGIDFKIAGCLHAGTYDPSDWTWRKGMSHWGGPLENCWFSFVDHIFVATNYHKSLLLHTRNVNENKIHVTGFPIYRHDIIATLPHPCTKEKMSIVFPHRLTEDKNPHLFDELLDRSNNTFWGYKTQEMQLSKNEYYRTLGSSHFAVSFAAHENWGIAMQEAVFCGCIPIVPDRLAYSEMYNDIFKYDGTVTGCLETLYDLLYESETHIKDVLIAQSDKFARSGQEAIEKMVRCMT